MLLVWGCQPPAGTEGDGSGQGSEASPGESAGGSEGTEQVVDDDGTPPAPGTTTPPTAIPSPPESGALPTDLLARIPADAELVIMMDVQAGIQTAGSIYGMDMNSAEVRDAVGGMIDEMLAQDGMGAMLGDGQTVDPFAVQSLAIGAWIDQESFVVVTQPGLLSVTPEEGAEPMPLGQTPFQMAVRGGHLILGYGAPFAAALAIEGGDGAFDPSTAWSEGWSVVPDGAMVAVFGSGLADLLGAMPTNQGVPVPPGGAPVPPTPNPYVEAGLERVVLGLTPGGGVGAAFDMADDGVLRETLGSIQSPMLSFDDDVRAALPPRFHGVANYVDLLARTMWGQVRLERTGTVTTLTVNEPTCGSVGSALMVAGVASAIFMTAGPGGPVAATPYENVEQAAQNGCAPITGPPASLPADLARVGAPAGANGVMFMADIGALLRANLTTLFGLLPYALDEAAVREALGEQPFGLASLETDEGQIAAYMETGAGAEFGQMGDMLLAMPTSMGDIVNTMAPPELAAQAAIVQDVGYVIGSPAMQSRLDQAADPTTVWSRALAAASDDSAVLAVVTGEMLRSGLGGRAPEGTLQTLLAQAEAVAVSSPAEVGLRIDVLLPNGANDMATNLQAELDSVLGELVGPPGAEGQGMMEQMLASWTSGDCDHRSLGPAPASGGWIRGLVDVHAPGHGSCGRDSGGAGSSGDAGAGSSGADAAFAGPAAAGSVARRSRPLPPAPWWIRSVLNPITVKATMSKSFRELVIQGRASTVRAFVDWALGEDAGRVYFNADHHIRGERGLAAVAEFLQLKTPLVHLVAETELADKLVDGLKRSTADLELRADEKVQGAKFNFDYELFSSKLAKHWNDRFRNPPEGVTVQGAIPEAKRSVELAGVEVEVDGEFKATAGAHGTVVGKLEPVLAFYKECLEETLIHADQIKLVYAADAKA